MEKSYFDAFKAYDIRAESPDPLGPAFATLLGSAIFTACNPRRVMVGRDMRLTSPELETALVESLVSHGVEVVKIGQCSTPMFNVLIGLADGAFDLGVMITASHNPGIYNGFKLTRGDCLPMGLGTGLERVREAMERAAGSSGRVGEGERGTITEDPTALQRYVDHVVRIADLPASMPKMKIVIDAGNGMDGFVLPALLERCPWIEAERLYFELDGRFPNHEANPIKEETLDMLKKRVMETGAMVGVAFDGDADRVGFVDEKGTWIPGGVLTAILADIQLRTHGPGMVLCDVCSTWSVGEAVEAAGGTWQMSKVGHANIKKMMRETGAVFAGESSMHFYFKELWSVDNGDYAMLTLLKALARTGRPMSETWKAFSQYAHSGEINFSVKDPQKVLQRVKDVFAGKADQCLELDGVRCAFGDRRTDPEAWWFSLRASNTEPLVRLNAEARTSEVLDRRLADLRTLIMDV